MKVTGAQKTTGRRGELTCYRGSGCPCMRARGGEGGGEEAERKGGLGKRGSSHFLSPPLPSAAPASIDCAQAKACLADRPCVHLSGPGVSGPGDYGPPPRGDGGKA